MPHKYTQNYPSERKDYPSKKISRKKSEPTKTRTERVYQPTQGDPNDGGKLSPADAERISSEDLPSSEPEKAA